MATELRSDRRTIARKLDAVPADGTCRGHPAWRLLSVLDHLRPAPVDPAALNPAQERARFDRARADAQEQRNHLMRRQMVTIDDTVRIVSEHYAQVRGALMELPGRVAQDLALETDPAAIERRLKAEIAAALAALNPEETVSPTA